MARCSGGRIPHLHTPFGRNVASAGWFGSCFHVRYIAHKLVLRKDNFVRWGHLVSIIARSRPCIRIMSQPRWRVINLHAPIQMKTGDILSSPRLLLLGLRKGFALPYVVCSCSVHFLCPRSPIRRNLLSIKVLSSQFGDRATAAALNSNAFSVCRSS